jgi:hypothetical protein
MYALKVRINNGPAIVAGADDLGVLSAIISCVGKLGSSAVPNRADETRDFTIRVGGLTSRPEPIANEHLLWLPNAELKPGDVVTVELIETEAADPINRAEEAERRASDERAYFEHCKEAYFELRKKYEPEA